MKRNILFKITSGDKTCSSSYKKFCKYVSTIKMGKIWVCRLFPSDKNSYTILEDKNGYLQRCPECKNNEQEKVFL